ncbi:MAG: HNH endonuclease [Mucilaginibacter sp.]
MGDEDNVPEWKKYLDSYKIKYQSYQDFYTRKGYEPDDAEDEHDYEYSEYLSELVIKEAGPYVVKEAFSVMFGDRKFLMEFNLLLSETVSRLKKADYPDLLEKDGIVKRCTYWPSWVERALTYRDQGSCAICLNDISGLLRTDFTRAVDYIVPLKLGGTNDITNLQLLCQDCNLKKLDHTVSTSEYYVSYF